MVPTWPLAKLVLAENMLGAHLLELGERVSIDGDLVGLLLRDLVDPLLLGRGRIFGALVSAAALLTCLSGSNSRYSLKKFSMMPLATLEGPRPWS